MSIPFTQYLMPDGRPVQECIDRSAEVEEKARAVMEAGYFFEMELLSDWSTVSFTVADRAAGVDLEIILVQNGPEVPDAVDRLVRTAFDNLATYASRVEEDGATDAEVLPVTETRDGNI